MTQPLHITVRWDPATTSPNRLVGKKKGHIGRLVGSARQAAAEGYLLAGRPQIAGKVRVSLIVRRGRTMDDDGVWGGLKWCRDQLFNRTKYGHGVTPDDSPRWFVGGGITWETGAQWKGREQVVYIVEEIGNA